MIGFPKPPRTPKKGPTPIARSSRPPRTGRGSSASEREEQKYLNSPPRKSRPNAVNRKRKASEFRRTYHSKARVAFVKALPCAWCHVRSEPSDNAHTTGGGMGRKGDYTTIAPLCRRHHLAYDEHRGAFNEPWAREFVARESDSTEKRWQAHVAATGGAL